MTSSIRQRPFAATETTLVESEGQDDRNSKQLGLADATTSSNFMANSKISRKNLVHSQVQQNKITGKGPRVVQITGADSRKTFFNERDLRELKKQVCSKGQPLILLHQIGNAGHETKFTLGSTQLRRYQDKEISLAELLAFRAMFFIDVSHLESPSEIALSSIIGNNRFDYHLVEALLGMNAYYQQESNEIYKRQCVVAAMIREGTLGFTDTLLSNQLVQKILSQHRQRALDESLFYCYGAKGASVAKHLLDFGASPNAQDEDQFSFLGEAVSRVDVPMVEFALSRGADPYLETLAEVSAVVKIRGPKFDILSPLFEKYVKAR